MTYGINPTKLNLPKVMNMYSEEFDRIEKKNPNGRGSIQQCMI
jgi:hypothetical protein